MALKGEKIVPTAVGVIYFFKCAPHSFPPALEYYGNSKTNFPYQLLCKLQMEFSPCLCRPHLSDDFIAFMESFVVQLPFFPVFLRLK